MFDQGMDYLHSSPLESHGALSAYTCMVDSRFTVKISDIGLWYLRDHKQLLPPTANEQERDYNYLLWRAPELLRVKMTAKGTQKGRLPFNTCISFVDNTILQYTEYSTSSNSTGQDYPLVMHFHR